MNRLSIKVEEIIMIMEVYSHIRVYRADSEGGQYANIADIEIRIDREIYYFEDNEGSNINWYQVAYYNINTNDESERSNPFQAGTQEKVGYYFGNYTPPDGEWGRVLTADDIRFHWMWGVDMVSENRKKDGVTDAQLNILVEAAMQEFERHFNMIIRKRVYKTNPDPSLIRAPMWKRGIDYTHKEQEYDFRKNEWLNYGYLRLRNRPILSIEKAEMYSPFDQKLFNVIDWLRVDEDSGEIFVYPKSASLNGTGYAGGGLSLFMPMMSWGDYPFGFRLDYTAGYPSSDYVPDDLRNAIGRLATIGILNWLGDGLMAGFSSSSVSIDGLSESFSSTQSATSAYFGARIGEEVKLLKNYIEEMKGKYGRVEIGFIGG